jgi:hypothetical protein
MTVLKFNIHVFQTMRVKFEVEAKDREHASKLVDAAIEGCVGRQVESELTTTYLPEYLVEPIIGDGSVDYKNAKWFGAEEED